MLEQQHWVWDWSLFQHALISIVAGGSVPFARVSRNNVTEIGQALDAGMLGIVVPMVHTAEDARRAGEAVRYPPRGVRSLGATHAQRYGSDYIEWADDQILMNGPDRIRPGRRQLPKPSSPNPPWTAAGSAPPTWAAPCSWSRKLPAPTPKPPTLALSRPPKTPAHFAGMSCGDGDEAALRIQQGMLFVSCGNDTRWIRRLGAEDLAIARAAKSASP